MTAESRRFLFLQGNASWFFKRLGLALAERGHGVRRINICGGDWWFWGDWQAEDFKGPPAAVGAYAGQVMDREGITDLILHNDTRRVHLDTIQEARRRGITPWVFEEGYLRPHWLTLEAGGINGYSPLPRDPDWYRAEAARLGPAPAHTPVGPGTKWRVLHDFRWQWANYRYAYRWPRYRTHRPYPIWAEYATWCTRLVTLKLRQAQARREVAGRAAPRARPFFLFPLQLDSDSQIRLHSPFGRLPAAIRHVIADFAAHAPADTDLVIKNHPLDNGWINYRRVVRRAARRHGVGERVTFLDGGDLNTLIDAARGTVMVNSTVGLTALSRGAATVCLGSAIYDMAGLTDQQPLAGFWTGPVRPDPALYQAFCRVLLDRALVNGNYYTEDGLRLAVANAVQEIESGRRIPRPSAEAGATAGVAAPATRLTPSDRSAS
jgi:capsular polysaccharide export protein